MPLLLIPLLQWLGGSALGKFCGWIMAIVLAVGLIFTAVTIHDHRIKADATRDYNLEQIRHADEAKQIYIENTKKLETMKQDYVHQLDEQQAGYEATLDSLQDQLTTKQFIKRDRGSSFVLKRTFQSLENMKR